MPLHTPAGCARKQTLCIYWQCPQALQGVPLQAARHLKPDTCHMSCIRGSCIT